uniref:Uncharacterized protein n=1 Tax=Sphaerodactylus townsendi TaxID=933632 RepID=A0ACB8FVD7_9SAUR
MAFEGQGLSDKIGLKAELQLDSLKPKGAVKRTLFFDYHQSQLVFPFMIDRRKRLTCKDFVVYLKDESEFRDKLSPIGISLNYSLDESTFSSGFAVNPVLNYYQESIVGEKAYILVDCGEDNLCIPDLKLSAVPTGDIELHLEYELEASLPLVGVHLAMPEGPTCRVALADETEPWSPPRTGAKERTKKGQCKQAIVVCRRSSIQNQMGKQHAHAAPGGSCNPKDLSSYQTGNIAVNSPFNLPPDLIDFMKDNMVEQKERFCLQGGIGTELRNLQLVRLRGRREYNSDSFPKHCLNAG